MAQLRRYGLAGVLVGLMILVGRPVSAQESTTGEVRGTVTDTSGAVLPGVTVTATHVQTGEVRTSVSSESGLYRLSALPLGDFVVATDLTGFRPVKREGITLRLGQSLMVNFTLEVGGLEETLTVQASAPLIETAKTEVAGLMVPDQIVNLPLMGRNWMELGLLMPGVSSTITMARGVSSGVGDDRDNSVIVDGVDSRNECCDRTSGTHSQEAISEFKMVTNNWSVEYGRSMANVTVAVTKSGSNLYRGSAFYFMRDEKLDADDFFLKRVEPISYFQSGASLGGPLKRDRVFFFGAFEHQHDEGTGSSSTGFPVLDNFTVPVRSKQNFQLVKADIMGLLPGPSQRVSVKYYHWNQDDLNGRNVTGGARLGGSKTPWSVSDQVGDNWGIVANSTWASQKWVNESTFGYTWTDWLYTPKAGIPIPTGFRNPEVHIPQLTTPTFQMGTQSNLPQDGLEFKYDISHKATRFFNWHGDHDLKVGANVIHGRFDLAWFNNQVAGSLTFTGSPVDPFDFNSYPAPTRFQLSLPRPGFTASCPDHFRTEFSEQLANQLNSCASYLPIPLNVYVGYVQDTWTPRTDLTVNMGLRYDLEDGPFLTNYLEKYTPQLDPQVPHPTKNDTNNLAPRFSLSYRPGGSDRTVIRAGGGVFFGSTVLNRSLNKLTSDGWASVTADQRNPTQQPCFAGHTLEEAITRNPRLLLPGCGALSFNELFALAGTKAINAFSPNIETDRAIHSSFGLARELTQDMGVEMDFVYQRQGPSGAGSDTNLFFDPATGGPLNPNIFGRPDPRFTTVTTYDSWAEAIYKAMSVRVNKRLSHNYQYQVAYTLASARDNSSGNYGGSGDNPFDRNEWGNSAGTQRHRLSINGMWVLPWGFQASGVFLTYSGPFYDDRVSGDYWGLGRATSRAFVQPDGTVVFLQKNSNNGDTFAKLDVRITKRIALGQGRDVGLSLDAFNVLNRVNFGEWGNNRSALSTYQQPLRNLNKQYASRQLQLGVRLTF